MALVSSRTVRTMTERTTIQDDGEGTDVGQGMRTVHMDLDVARNQEIPLVDASKYYIMISNEKHDLRFCYDMSQ